MKPIFKNQLVSTVIRDNNVFFYTDEECIEVEDPHGTFLNFVNSLNGENDLGEISKKSDMSEDEALELIEQLNEVGLIENNEHLLSSSLSKEDLERYKSHYNFFSTISNINQSKYSFQEKLIDSSIAVMGLGGSSVLLSCLAGMGVGTITGVDYDKVELGNLNRQFLFSEGDLGEPKTSTCAKSIKKINSNVNFISKNLKVENSTGLNHLLASTDIVINTIDQPSILSTRWVNYACSVKGIPLIQGGTGNNKLLFQVFYTKHSGCYDCYLLELLEEHPEYKHELKEMYGKKLEGRNPAYAPNIAFLAGLITNEASNILLNTAANMESYTAEYKSFTLEKSITKNWNKKSYCPTCSNRNTFDSEPVPLDELIKISEANSIL
ncbi:ThiF family adenylyltransferase [Rossellomorea marisflavi]|uniref:HesA/MoeB/ThiF family protein n=1 Tax=Rossellomorea marisflavi TaxID=189381 RepID=UPI0012EF3F9C|nr:ThiF family adenylyltransferase [Rossellomorea marisflavi]MDW4526179.1 ThiF family adenylyltransferase [Rossellomorea marisflavi]VXB24789.1 conserved hypothetical protein [Bacillus sp. 349Y]